MTVVLVFKRLAAQFAAAVRPGVFRAIELIDDQPESEPPAAPVIRRVSSELVCRARPIATGLLLMCCLDRGRKRLVLKSC